MSLKRLEDDDFRVDMDEDNWYLIIKLTNQKHIEPLKKAIIELTKVKK